MWTSAQNRVSHEAIIHQMCNSMKYRRINIWPRGALCPGLPLQIHSDSYQLFWAKSGLTSFQLQFWKCYLDCISARLLESCELFDPLLTIYVFSQSLALNSKKCTSKVHPGCRKTTNSSNNSYTKWAAKTSALIVIPHSQSETKRDGTSTSRRHVVRQCKGHVTPTRLPDVKQRKLTQW